MKTKKMVLIIIFSLFILIVSQVLAQLISSVFLVIKVPEFICNVLAGILYITFAFIFIKLLCKKYIKDDMSNYNIPKFIIEVKWLVIAIALPLLVSAAYLLFVSGSFMQNEMSINEKLNLLSAGIFFTGFGAGIVEEMVFRGLMMSAIEKRYNKKVAIIVPSLLFGFVHILGMDFDLLSCMLVIFAGTMVGIMFSLIASETKSIWNSAIVHAVWNIVILGGFIWIGTEFDEYSLCSYVLDTKSFILTGGEFGIESSLIAVIGYCLVSILARSKLIWKTSEN
ncbi:MAG: CPBP family intramembrane metalloprotease [Lachnospiraceae bacterium]|nr:CPBP family intramembrane metalloprotease [Lachnospiraceae bacterium]